MLTIINMVKGGIDFFKVVSVAITGWMKDRADQRLIKAGEDAQGRVIAEQALKDNQKAKTNENDVHNLNDDDLFDELRDGPKNRR